MKKWNTKCRFFDEKYACDTLTTEGYKNCGECQFAIPYSKKILIIKFGALGDVIRTTPVLEAIKKKYGQDVLIYWLTSEKSKELLQDNHLIDKIFIYNLENILRLQQEKFDVLFSLEIDTPTILLANLINADEKYGYYFDNGTTSCFNENAEEYLDTAFLNHIKLQSRRTYQELIFKAAELQYNKEFPIIRVYETHKVFANDFKIKNNISENDKLVGFHIGSASRWPSKAWPNEKIMKFIKNLSLQYKIILFAGPNDIEKQKTIINELKQQGIKIISNNPKNTCGEFAAILNLCDIVITNDTFPLHMAIALKKPTIALFFCTPPWEIEGYDLVKKITSPLLEKYFFTNKYIDELVNSISVEEVLQTLREIESTK